MGTRFQDCSGEAAACCWGVDWYDIELEGCEEEGTLKEVCDEEADVE